MTPPVSTAGLSSQQAAARLAAEGANELPGARRRGFGPLLLEVLREPMFGLLLAAGAIYLLMGDAREAAALLGFVLIVIAVTVLQERRTERVLDALRDLSSPRALVLRDGVATRIPGREVVRGDLMLLSEGDRVAADGDVLAAHELAADESLLSGESAPVAKSAQADAPAGAARVFAGTVVVAGQGRVGVSAIGADTELGRIGRSLDAIEPENSPLQREIALLTRRLALLAGVVCLLLVGAFVLLRGEWLQALLAGVTLAMAILPQEFPVILIIFLALGARRIAQQQVLTRKLSAIETLGETTVLCVDKTGTLTENRMAVAALSVAGTLFETGAGALPAAAHELLRIAVLASETEPHDPMEKALHRLGGATFGADPLHADWKLTREYELSPALLAMSHVWRDPLEPGYLIAAKGAPEAVAQLCALDDARRDALLAEAAALADRGWRVLAVARADHGEAPLPDTQQFAYTLVGLVALADPLRRTVPRAIAECRAGGIRVVMITGDHPATARAIAAQAGLPVARIVSGAELEAMSPAALARAVREVAVFARVAPAQKLRIVQALKADGEIVAMTGDGVNDAPALKAAHIGIAMGQRGTDVAREAAALVLLHDDFGSIVATIRLGRRIFANLRKAMSYTLAVHMPVIGLSALPLLFGLPPLLLPVHIAFLELVINPTCSVVFEAEAHDERRLSRPPRRPDERLVDARVIALALVHGLIITLLVAVTYVCAGRFGFAAAGARALAFISLIAADTALIFSSRSPAPGWRGAFRGVPAIADWVVSITLLALVLVTAWAPLARFFSFAPVPLPAWMAAFGWGAGAWFCFEGAKWLLRARGNKLGAIAVTV